MTAARRAGFLLGALLAAVGVLAVAFAGLSAAGREPVGALIARDAQAQLRTQFAALQQRHAALPTGDARRSMLARARAAGRLEARARPGAPLGRLEVPAIDLSLVWAQGVDDGTLARGPGHYRGTALPGRRGTVGIAGHRTTHGAPFRRLDRLRGGDRIVLTMPWGRYEYVVERTRIVSPDRAEVLRTARADRVVLTTCHPVWSAKERLVVVARLVRWPDAGKDQPPLTSRPDARSALPGAPALTRTPRPS